MILFVILKGSVARGKVTGWQTVQHGSGSDFGYGNPFTLDSTVGEGVEAELVELTLFLLLELVMPVVRPCVWPYLPRSILEASRSVATLAARVRDSVVGRCTVDGQRPSSAAGIAGAPRGAAAAAPRGAVAAPLGTARGVADVLCTPETTSDECNQLHAH